MIDWQFNWYTKRVSLAAVYKSTEIYLIQDRSEDYTDTWNFLENRLEDVVSAGHLARNVRNGVHWNFKIFLWSKSYQVDVYTFSKE